MKTTIQFAVSLILVVCFVIHALPCGPSAIMPVFENENAPENPYANYAAGSLGIVSLSFGARCCWPFIAT